MRKLNLITIFALVAVFVLSVFVITACKKNSSPTSSSPGSVYPTATPTNTPMPQFTYTPVPSYGYVDVNFSGNSLFIWSNIFAYVDGNQIAISNEFAQSVCSKRLTVGPHTVQIQITGGCLDGIASRLYYTNTSGVTSYGTSWTWNLNVQAGGDYYFDMVDYNSSFSSCSYPGMAYVIHPYLFDSTHISCWQ